MCNLNSLKTEFDLLVLKKVKIFTSKFFISGIFLLTFVNCIEAQGPPPPPGEPPPVVPIDDSLLLATLIAVSFGIYIICKYKLKQKTPI